MRGARVATVLLLTAAGESGERVLPALALLPHDVRVAPLATEALLDAFPADVILLDARSDLAAARALSQLSRTLHTPPVLLLVTEGAWSVVAMSWGATDIVAESAAPAEVDARIRMAVERASCTEPDTVETGDLVIDASGYTARLRGQALDLTYKEFELLRHLAANPGRVFTRAQLLQEVWGYDYFGGTRTVDVHVRRLRAKLGADYDQLIGTVRNVGYRFNPDSSAAAGVP